MFTKTRNWRGGFTLIELLIVIAIIALLVAILLPALSEARRAARKVLCAANQQQVAVASANYSTDFQDKCASFTWKKGFDYGFGGVAADATQAAANQAVDILRRRADRTDITAIAGWIPHVLYSHLILNDYLQQRLPESSMACPEDRIRRAWQAATRESIDGFFSLIERPTGSSNNEKRWPYSSSYSFVPSYWSPDQAVLVGGVTIPTVSQAGVHNLFNVPGAGAITVLGNRRFSDANFPSQKVMLYEMNDWHTVKKRAMYHAYTTAKAQLGFFDASVRILETKSGNRGFNPATPNAPAATTYQYSPELAWEPECRNRALTSEVVFGHYRWTRGGLKGVDFGGGEVDAVP